MNVFLLISAIMAVFFEITRSQDYPNYDNNNQNYDTNSQNYENTLQQQQNYDLQRQPATVSSAYATTTGYDQNNQYQNTNQASYDAKASGQENYQNGAYNQVGYAPASGYTQGGYVTGYSQTGYAPATNYAQGGYAAPATNYAPANNYAPAPATTNYAPTQVTSYSQTGYAPATGYTQNGYVTNYAPATGYVQNYAPAPVAYDPNQVYTPVKANYAQVVNQQAHQVLNQQAHQVLNQQAPVVNQQAHQVVNQAPIQVEKSASVGCHVVGPIKSDIGLDHLGGDGLGLAGLKNKPLIIDPTNKPLGILSKAVQQSLANTRAGIKNGIKGLSNIAAAGINLQTGIIGALQAIPVKAINAVAVATNNLANIGRTAVEPLLLSKSKTTTLGGGILSG